MATREMNMARDRVTGMRCRLPGFVILNCFEFELGVAPGVAGTGGVSRTIFPNLVAILEDDRGWADLSSTETLLHETARSTDWPERA